MRIRLLPTLFILPLLVLTQTVGAQGHQVRKLEKELDYVEAYVDRRDSLSPEVSAVPVAWHLDHLLKVITAIHGSLQSSDPAQYHYSFKPVRTVVFTMGRFPRGVAESPTSVRPPETILTKDIYAQLATARTLLSTFADMDKKQSFDHPVFGALNRRRTVKFI